MKVGFAAGLEDDFKLALLALYQHWARDLDRVAICCCVRDFELAAAVDLKPIVEVGAGGERVVAEGGAGVFDLKQLDGRAGAIFDGCIDVVGMAAREEGD